MRATEERAIEHLAQSLLPNPDGNLEISTELQHEGGGVAVLDVD